MVTSHGKMLKEVLVALIVCVSSTAYGAGCPRIVCYHTNWSQYRPGEGKFMPENIDSTLCTHINYAFAKLQGNQLKAFEWNDESTPWMKGMYEKFTSSAKSKNPNVKVQLSVGGWNMGSGTFTQMVSTSSSRHEFATTSVKFLRDHGFDGLDIDWEYPAGRGSPAGDRQKYVDLLKEIKSVFEQDHRSTGKPQLLLTAAVAAGKPNIDPGYDVPQIVKYLDFINLMTYDLHGSWEAYTGENSPLFPSSSETGDNRHLNVDWVAKYWVSLGAPKDKLVIGMGTYGRSFTLKDTNHDHEYDPTRGKGLAGRFTREGGFLAYYEICDMLNQGGVVHQETEQMVPYVVKGNQWVGFDNEASLQQKVRYMKSNHYGGVMIWAIDLDDFKGTKCGKGPFPLMHTIFNECGSTGGILNTPAPQVTSKPHQGVSTHQPPAHTTNSHHGNIAHSQDFVCSGKPDGFYASPYDCQEYYICAGQTAYKTICAEGLIFNSNTAFCDWPKNFHCRINGMTYTQAPHTQAPQHTQAPHHTQAPQHTQAPGGHVDLANFCHNKEDGIHTDPSDCTYFFDCANGNTFRIPCAPGTAYSPSINTCDMIANVAGCNGK